MPPGKLWHFETEDGNAYLVIGNTRSKYGAIKGIKKPSTCSAGEENNLKV